MAGHTVDAIPGMLGFHPGLKETGGYSLVAFHAKSGVHLGRFVPRPHTGYPRAEKEEAQKDKKTGPEMLFHFPNLSFLARNFARRVSGSFEILFRKTPSGLRHYSISAPGKKIER
jgi:hypothetical protein